MTLGKSARIVSGSARAAGEEEGFGHDAHEHLQH